MKKSIIFWDYSNFHSTLKGLTNGTWPGRDVKFDYGRFVEGLVRGTDLIKVYFACSMSENGSAALTKFFDWADHQPYFYVKSFERRSNPETGKENEKQVDVYLATQIVALAYENAYDVGILISGDEDYVPAIEIVQQKGKVITAISDDRSISAVLKRKADRTILLDNEGEYNYRNYLTGA